MYPVVSIQKLNYFYQEGRKKKQVLFDIDFEMTPQEVVLLTGESGSGKTTLLSLIGCLRSIQDGNLTVLGQSLRQTNAAERVRLRRRIGYIFQHFNLLEFMTIQQNVMISLELQSKYDVDQAKAMSAHMLESVGLAQHIHLYPKDLSGGEKQRVAIARALVHCPQLLLADEPTSSLDRRTGREVIELIINLAREQGSAILIVTHDSRIFDVTNRLIRMEDGRLDIDDKERLSIVLPTLSDKQLLFLMPRLKTFTFSPGEIILHQGVVSNRFYIILEGVAEVISQDEAIPSQLKILNPNDFFGEAGLIYKVPQPFTIRAAKMSSVKVSVIESHDFDTIIVNSAATRAFLGQHI